jgi:transglutaminase-like putative cysteine protease
MPNSEEIIDTALSIKGDDENVLTILLNLARWFEDNVVYTSNVSVPQDVSYTFATKSGDCDDQANLFVTFCRIIGIPAYTTLGPIYIPGQTIESEENLRFNLTNAAWHGWAMAYLPGNGSQWIPIDLTFFRGAVLIDGHVRSSDVMQHITGSALVYYDTLEYAYVKNIDYVSLAVESKDNITSSDSVWVEQHSMTIYGQQPSTFGTLDPFSILLFMVAILALIVFVITYLRRRSHSAAQPQAASV